MSVMRVVILHIPSLEFVGLRVMKMWVIFGHGVQQPDNLDL